MSLHSIDGGRQRTPRKVGHLYEPESAAHKKRQRLDAARDFFKLEAGRILEDFRDAKLDVFEGSKALNLDKKDERPSLEIFEGTSKRVVGTVSALVKRLLLYMELNMDYELSKDYGKDFEKSHNIIVNLVRRHLPFDVEYIDDTQNKQKLQLLEGQAITNKESLG